VNHFAADVDPVLARVMYAVQQALAACVTIPPLILVAAAGQLFTTPQILGIVSAVGILAGLASRLALV